MHTPALIQKPYGFDYGRNLALLRQAHEAKPVIRIKKQLRDSSGRFTSRMAVLITQGHDQSIAFYTDATYRFKSHVVYAWNLTAGETIPQVWGTL